MRGARGRPARVEALQCGLLASDAFRSRMMSRGAQERVKALACTQRKGRSVLPPCVFSAALWTAACALPEKSHDDGSDLPAQILHSHALCKI